MKRLMLAVLMTAFTIGSAAAQATCESKAVGKDGKPSATASFLRPSSACIYREDRQRFVVLIFRIQGRQTATS